MRIYNPDIDKLTNRQQIHRMELFLRDIPEPVYKSFIDYDIEDIEKITNKLLAELVLNEHCTSVSRVIPLVEDHPLKMVMGLYMDEENLINTCQCIKDDKTPAFLSTYDIIQCMVKILHDNKGSMLYHELSYMFHRLAYDLRFIDEFEEEYHKKEREK